MILIAYKRVFWFDISNVFAGSYKGKFLKYIMAGRV